MVFTKEVEFILCDFRGVDTMTMEFLKCLTAKVTIYHIGENPRYLPDKYRTKVSLWELLGVFLLIWKEIMQQLTLALIIWHMILIQMKNVKVVQ
jgi:hypothetical protein